MPYTRNAIDGRGVYYEDDGGSGQPVVFLAGLAGSVSRFRTWGVSEALEGSYRRIFVDHRGHGRSDKPHDPEAYTTVLRVADVVAALDAIGLDRTHVIGASWGARLAFGIGSYAPERVLSLTMGGQVPYAMDTNGPLVKAVTAALQVASQDAMSAFDSVLAAFGKEESVGPEPQDNDAEAIRAGWMGALAEGAAAENLADWRLPCLIYAGTEDADFFEGAKRAAREIPDARFLPLRGLNHLGAHADVDHVLPEIKSIIDG